MNGQNACLPLKTGLPLVASSSTSGFFWRWNLLHQAGVSELFEQVQDVFLANIEFDLKPSRHLVAYVDYARWRLD
nr:hypothetical protein [Methylocystis sp. H62]